VIRTLSVPSDFNSLRLHHPFYINILNAVTFKTNLSDLCPPTRVIFSKLLGVVMLNRLMRELMYIVLTYEVFKVQKRLNVS